MIAKDKKQKTISMEGIHMNYVVIDLEMCKVPKMYRNKMYKYAIILYEKRINLPRDPLRIVYLRANASSAANTRVLRGLRKCLSVSGLHFPTIRSASYGVAKWPISHSDMAHFVPRYAQYRTMIKPISQNRLIFHAIRKGKYDMSEKKIPSDKAHFTALRFLF